MTLKVIIDMLDRAEEENKRLRVELEQQAAMAADFQDAAVGQRKAADRLQAQVQILREGLERIRYLHANQLGEQDGVDVCHFDDTDGWPCQTRARLDDLLARAEKAGRE